MKIKKITKNQIDFEYGTNPCSEIILRPNAFCNLSEVVVRPEDDYQSLSEKVRLATILGTYQATLTDFKYLRKVWKDNTEEERLLGVSLTGIMDNEVLSDSEHGWAFETFTERGDSLETILENLKGVAIDTNKRYSEEIGIPQSTAITCVKPSGTVSQLVDSASGIHPRYSQYYIRTVRGDLKDPLSKFLIDMGVPNEPAIGQESSTVVFSFPHSSPAGSSTRHEGTALDQLQLWLTYARHWCEHKPSITVYVREDEWMEVGAFVYRHFDEMSGVSFLPYDSGTYQQAPYQEITKEEYERFLSEFPTDIDWGSFREEEDNTVSSQSYACTGDVCEVVDIS